LLSKRSHKKGELSANKLRTKLFISQELTALIAAMEVDEEEFEVPSSSSKGEKKRFEVKKVGDR